MTAKVKSRYGRQGDFKRNTAETKIKLFLNLDGKGTYDIKTGVPFFDHMLEQLARHSHFDINLKAKGDIEVDLHHLIEDTGIVIGNAVNKLAGDKKGIKRFADAAVPMDDALVLAAVDFSGRSFFVYKFFDFDFNDPNQLNLAIDNFAINELIHLPPGRGEIKIADLKNDPSYNEFMARLFFLDYVNIFFEALSKNALMNLHINVLYGENFHHIVEAIFKSAAVAISGALSIDDYKYGIPSTKGII